MDQPPAQQPETPPAAPNPEPPPAPPPQEGSWATPVEPTGPAPGLQFGGYGGRLIAYIVDVILVSVIGAVISFFLAIIGLVLAAGGLDILAGATFVILFAAIFLVSLGYFPWFWWRSGQTPGMRLFRLRVVRDRDGGPISGGQAVLRLIGFWINNVVLYLGWIWIFVDARRRGWHDLIAGTVVIEEER